jgi:hypothetical protein
MTSFSRKGNKEIRKTCIHWFQATTKTNTTSLRKQTVPTGKLQENNMTKTRIVTPMTTTLVKAFTKNSNISRATTQK